MVFFSFASKTQLNNEMWVFLQAFLACAFRPDRTRKYLYTERGGEDGDAPNVEGAAQSSSVFPSKKCGVFRLLPPAAPAPAAGFLERVPFLVLLLFAPGSCALQGCDVCVVEPGPLQQGGRPAALLVLEGGGPGVVPDDLTVGGGRALHAPAAPVARGADARVTAGGAGAAQHGTVHQVAVEDRSVRGRAHGLAVQLQLLLGVPQLEGAGALVGRGLLPVRQRDGGRQVDLVLQVRVRGLEAVEAVPLGEGRHSQTVGGPWRGVDLRLEGVEQSQGSPEAGPEAGGRGFGWPGLSALRGRERGQQRILLSPESGPGWTLGSPGEEHHRGAEIGSTLVLLAVATVGRSLRVGSG